MVNTADILTLSSGTDIDGIFVIADASLRPFKNASKGNFLTFELRDKKGQIAATAFNHADTYYEIVKNAKVCRIQGKVNVYQGQNQIIVSSIEETNPYNPVDFLPTSPHDPDEMWVELVQIMDDKVKNKYMRDLWDKFKNNETFVHKFKMCPGGKGNVHHAYLHGLLEHTLCVTKICSSFCYIYPIDPSIICMGAFLHDHGKMFSYTYDLTIEMTDIGRLHSHLNLSYTNIIPIINALEAPPEERNRMKKILGHLILSHHGSLDLGAAVVPMTPEAILLSKADIIDSEYNLSTIYTNRIIEGNWSAYDNLKSKFYFKE